MYTIKEQNVISQTINKSEFIASIFPVNSIDEVNTILTEIRKKYYDATHNCYAYILGNNAEIIKFSDDKEPSQTAGVVIYDCLRKKDLTNCLVIVTRYFGGIKLGAGGLVRAYSSSTALVLEKTNLYKITNCLLIQIECSYVYLQKILSELTNYEESSKMFLDNVYLEYIIPSDDFESIKKNLISITKGNAIISIKKEIMKAF